MGTIAFVVFIAILMYITVFSLFEISKLEKINICALHLKNNVKKGKCKYCI
ncbi:hypothetical protein Hanom_Chr07g00681411 [Helianthus anomalus]